MKIKFQAQDYFAADLIDEPKPAIECVPDWYKEMSEYHFGRIGEPTMKSHLPFADTFSMGYIQETWSDIFIESNNDDLKIMHTPSNGTPGAITTINMSPPASKDLIKMSEEYHSLETIWIAPWMPQTPLGYSTLITHPLNRNDLPFTTLTFVIDSDKYWADRRIPFFIKKGFEGIIPKGTPMYQMIPFKRDSWKKTKSEFDEVGLEKMKYWITKYIKDGYKKQFWNIKDYQ